MEPKSVYFQAIDGNYVIGDFKTYDEAYDFSCERGGSEIIKVSDFKTTTKYDTVWENEED